MILTSSATTATLRLLPRSLYCCAVVVSSGKEKLELGNPIKREISAGLKYLEDGKVWNEKVD